MSDEELVEHKNLKREIIRLRKENKTLKRTLWQSQNSLQKALESLHEAMKRVPPGKSS